MLAKDWSSQKFRRMWDKLSHDPVSFESNYPTLQLDRDTLSIISKFADSMLPFKRAEDHVKRDGNRLWERHYHGKMGEVGVEWLIGESFTDWDRGASVDYNYPDLERIGLACGVKTVEIGKFPLVSTKPKCGQIVCVVDGDWVFVCGYADIETLSMVDDDEVLDSRVDLNIKSAFVGFDKLKTFNDKKGLEDLL